MDHLHELIFIFLAFVSELVGTASGVSSSTLFVPLAMLLETAKVALALTALLHVIGNIVRVFIFRRTADWTLAFKFGVPSILFAALGAQYSDYFSSQIYSLILGIFLILISSLYLIFKTDQLFKGRWLPYVGGAISGLLTGLLGSGGALRSLALLSFQLNPVTFVATSTIIDFGGDVVRLVIYLQKGYLNPEHYFYVPIFFIVAVSANFIAGKWVHKVQSITFKKILLIFVFIMGCVSVASSLKS